MTLNSKPNSASIISEPNTEVSLIFTIRGLADISVVFEAVGGNFNNQSYSIFVSNDGSEFIKLRDVKMGYDNVISNSWTPENQGYHGSPVYWAIVKISVPALGADVRCKALISGR